MSTILRLEGLDVKAGTQDIREFFKSLHIPDGGVYIMGGSLGEAFIAFANENDAQIALLHNGNFLKGSMVFLHASSIKEMEQKLESFGKKTVSPERKTQYPAADKISPKHTSDLKPGYVRLFGLPSSTTKEEICTFFKGLHVKEVIVNVELGKGHGCLVKFANMQDASDALSFNLKLLGSFCVERKRSADNQVHLEPLKKPRHLTDTAFLIFNRRQDFDYAINLSGCHAGSGAIEVTSITKQIMWGMVAKNNPRNRRTGPTDPRLHSHLRKPDQQKTGTSQIRSLFCKFNLSLDDIMLLHDSEGRGRGEAVVTFESEQQAAEAQRMHGEEFLGTSVLLTLINGEQVENILNN
uniref:RNA binding motif protein 12Ba n=1 Tax=Cyprinodon variegatus TaxID=28743 RepID=A0A3Q2CQ50_CYPVA